MKPPGSSQFLFSVPTATSLETIEFTRDAEGLSRSGDIPITVFAGTALIFAWPDAVAYGLMVDSSLRGDEPTLWEINRALGFSSSVIYGQCPKFVQEIRAPLPLLPGQRYFVSVYGPYPRYGIQEFLY